jgi:hypothetical protein
VVTGPSEFVSQNKQFKVKEVS